MATRDDLIAAERELYRTCLPGEAPMSEAVVDAVLDALASRVPSVCPSGFDWTAGDIEDWLRAVKEGRA